MVWTAVGFIPEIIKAATQAPFIAGQVTPRVTESSGGST